MFFGLSRNVFLSNTLSLKFYIYCAAFSTTTELN